MMVEDQLRHDAAMWQVISANRFEMAQLPSIRPEEKTHHMFMSAFYARKARRILFKLIGDNEDECLSS
jgi:hypothetical protein